MADTPMTLQEVERYLTEKEIRWRDERSKCYETFVALLRTGRTLTQDKALLDILDRLEDIQCQMANADTVRYIGNGIRAEAVKREFGDGDTPRSD